MINFKTYLDNVIKDPGMYSGEVKPSFILEFPERCFVITCEKLKKDLAFLGIEDSMYINVITEETGDFPSVIDKNRVFLFHESRPRKNSAAGKTIEKIVNKIFPEDKFDLQSRRGLTSLVLPPKLAYILTEKYEDVLKISESIDSTSKEFYIKLLTVLKNGRKSILTKYISPEFKMYNELVVPSKNDTVVSGGVCNSIEVTRIMNQIGPKGKLIGFEPSKIGFDELGKIHKRNVEINKLALSSFSSPFVRFDENGGDSKVDPRGSNEVKQETIDAVLHNEKKCNLIKLNINGYELNALKGAKRTITRWKPKIQVLVVPENVVEIPKLLLSYNKDYTFYFGYYDKYNNLDNIILYAM